MALTETLAVTSHHIVDEVADTQARFIEYPNRPWPQRLEPLSNVVLEPLSQLKDMRAVQQCGAASIDSNAHRSLPGRADAREA